MLSPRSCKQCLRQRKFVKTIGNDMYKASSWLWFVIHSVSTLLRRRQVDNEKGEKILILDFTNYIQVYCEFFRPKNV